MWCGVGIGAARLFVRAQGRRAAKWSVDREVAADRLLCGEVVLVEQTAESVAAADARFGIMRQDGRPLE